MKKLLLILVLATIPVRPAGAMAPTEFRPGTGHHGALPSGRDACWSEPPDLEGLIGTSEQILMYGLESEIANDFVVGRTTTITKAAFWGGIPHDYPCDPGFEYRCHNLRFYNDTGCAPDGQPDHTPGGPQSEYLGVDCHQELVVCVSGVYPIYSYWASVSVPVTGGTRYWFGAQMCDHPYPPSWGRLSSAGVVGCESVFWSPYFGFPEWTPCGDAFGLAFDASQEFECEETTAAATTSWGAIKGLYR